MASISKRASGAWQNTSYGIRATAKDTITTLPTTIYTDGTPLIDYLISGNTVQSGTPTPESPIMPEGCGERTGNLFDMSFYEGKSGITVSGNKATGTCDRFFNVKLSIPPELYGQELTWSVYLKRPDNPNTVRLQAVDNGSYNYGNNITGEGRSTVSFTATSTIKLYVNYANTGSDTIELSDITLNLGSTALPYEPYGYKIPISSADTTTPVYLGEVQSTRRIKKLVLTGTEDWAISSAWKKTNTSVFYFPVSDIGGTSDNERYILSTHFASKSRAELYRDDIEGIGKTDSNAVTVRVNDTIATTVNDFKAWLRDNNVTVWYVLATETTGIVNEPIMRIGDYADTVSKAQAGVNIPTNNGSTTVDVDTTVKPSEVSINYHGWHMGTIHERVSGAWD